MDLSASNPCLQPLQNRVLLKQWLLQAAWEGIATGPNGDARTLTTTVESVPDLKTLMGHLTARSFNVIASGNKGGILKIYACARSAGDISALFLLEMIFSLKDRQVIRRLGSHACAFPRQLPVPSLGAAPQVQIPTCIGWNPPPFISPLSPSGLSLSLTWFTPP